MQISTLTPVQNQVIAAISAGSSIKSAALAGNIHRNTIAYWRQTSPAFREALTQAQFDRVTDIREQAQSYVDEAFAAVYEVLTDSSVSASARLKAARMIIDQASTPVPAEPELENVHSFAPIQSRNTLCACGSGIKFKRCCAGNPKPAPLAENDSTQHSLQSWTQPRAIPLRSKSIAEVERVGSPSQPSLAPI
jgi:uncharacterized protein YchJ